MATKRANKDDTMATGGSAVVSSSSLLSSAIVPCPISSDVHKDGGDDNDVEELVLDADEYDKFQRNPHAYLGIADTDLELNIEIVQDDEEEEEDTASQSAEFASDDPCHTSTMDTLADQAAALAVSSKSTVKETTATTNQLGRDSLDSKSMGSVLLAAGNVAPPNHNPRCNSNREIDQTIDDYHIKTTVPQLHQQQYTALATSTNDANCRHVGPPLLSRNARGQLTAESHHFIVDALLDRCLPDGTLPNQAVAEIVDWFTKSGTIPQLHASTVFRVWQKATQNKEQASPAMMAEHQQFRIKGSTKPHVNDDYTTITTSATPATSLPTQHSTQPRTLPRNADSGDLTTESWQIVLHALWDRCSPVDGSLSDQAVSDICGQFVYLHESTVRRIWQQETNYTERANPVDVQRHQQARINDGSDSHQEAATETFILASSLQDENVATNDISPTPCDVASMPLSTASDTSLNDIVMTTLPLPILPPDQQKASRLLQATLSGSSLEVATAADSELPRLAEATTLSKAVATLTTETALAESAPSPCGCADIDMDKNVPVSSASPARSLASSLVESSTSLTKETDTPGSMLGIRQALPCAHEQELTDETRQLLTQAILDRCVGPKPTILKRHDKEAIADQFHVHPDVVVSLWRRIRKSPRAKPWLGPLQKFLVERNKNAGIELSDCSKAAAATSDRNITGQGPSTPPILPLARNEGSVIVGSREAVGNALLDRCLPNGILEKNAIPEIASRFQLNCKTVYATWYRILESLATTGTLGGSLNDGRKMLKLSHRQAQESILCSPAPVIDAENEACNPVAFCPQLDCEFTETGSAATVDRLHAAEEVTPPNQFRQPLAKAGGNLTPESREIVCNALLDKCLPNGSLEKHATKELADRFEISTVTVYTIWKRILASVVATGAVDPTYTEEGTKRWFPGLDFDKAYAALSKVLAQRGGAVAPTERSTTTTTLPQNCSAVAAPDSILLVNCTSSIASSPDLAKPATIGVSSDQRTAAIGSVAGDFSPQALQDATASDLQSARKDADVAIECDIEPSSDLKAGSATKELQRETPMPHDAPASSDPVIPVTDAACSTFEDGHDMSKSHLRSGALVLPGDSRPSSSKESLTGMQSNDDCQAPLADAALDNGCTGRCVNEKPTLPNLLSPIDEVVEFLSRKYVQEYQHSEDAFRADVQVRMMVNHVHFMMDACPSILLHNGHDDSSGGEPEFLARLCFCENYHIHNKHCQLFWIQSVHIHDDAMKEQASLFCRQCDARQVAIKEEDTCDEIKLEGASDEVRKEDSSDMVPDLVSSLSGVRSPKTQPPARKRQKPCSSHDIGLGSIDAEDMGRYQATLMDTTVRKSRETVDSPDGLADIVRNIDMSSMCATPPRPDESIQREMATCSDSGPQRDRAVEPGKAVAFVIGGELPEIVQKPHWAVSPIGNPKTTERVAVSASSQTTLPRPSPIEDAVTNVGSKKEIKTLKRKAHSDENQSSPPRRLQRANKPAPVRSPLQPIAKTKIPRGVSSTMPVGSTHSSVRPPADNHHSVMWNQHHQRHYYPQLVPGYHPLHHYPPPLYHPNYQYPPPPGLAHHSHVPPPSTAAWYGFPPNAFPMPWPHGGGGGPPAANHFNDD